MSRNEPKLKVGDIVVPANSNDADLLDVELNSRGIVAGVEDCFVRVVFPGYVVRRGAGWYLGRFRKVGHIEE